MTPGPQTFDGLQPFRDLVEELEDVQERPVHVDGEIVPRYKALQYVDSRRTVAVVGRNFTPFQHRLVLGEVADVLAGRDMQPHGYMTVNELGRLSTKLHFPNPRFRLDIRLGSTNDHDLMFLGLALENSYGEPSCALQVEAMGLNPNRGNHMLLGPILGRTKIPHFGDVQDKVMEAIGRLTLDAELLANCIQEADANLFDSRQQANLALRGAGFGPRLAKAILDGNRRTPAMLDPISAWRLFDRISQYVCAQSIGEQGRNEHLRRAQGLLHPDAIYGLVEAGERLLRDEEANLELAQSATETEDAIATA